MLEKALSAEPRLGARWQAPANAPRILLADEPTGNLDPRTAGHVFETLTQFVRPAHGRRVTLQEGRVVEVN